MAKPILQTKPSSFPRDRILSITAVAAAILTFLAVWTFADPRATFSSLLSARNAAACGGASTNTSQISTEKTFYDDPETRYTIDKPMINWDEKRKHWLNHNPTFGPKSKNGVIIVTGSQPSACKNPLGDHLLLRFFKNKIDYCRIHGYEIFYNNAFLDPRMRSFWAKIPVIKAAMVAHPEKEWVFWVDSDAIFTDMDFKVPFERYEEHNLVVHGWPKMIYEEKSWVAVNAGVFLMRNCQWSMDFLDAWAEMGPKSPDYKKWGRILKSTLKDKLFPESDDQSAMIYLILKGRKKWREMIYVENKYSLHGYWLGIVGKLDGGKGAERLRRRRHAETASECYAAEREEGGGGRRRPFVTHFTGCQPCSGEHNPAYEGDSCYVGMEKALNYADNQVLRSYGFLHPDITNGSYVTPLPFDIHGDEF
ncbi:hypothetical protein ABFS82_08G059600 [Erythranthe guttata]